jgi:hypothetical protein
VIKLAAERSVGVMIRHQTWWRLAPAAVVVLAAAGCGSAARTGQSTPSAKLSSAVVSTQTASAAAHGRRRSGVEGQAIEVGCSQIRTGAFVCPRHPARAAIAIARTPVGRQFTIKTDRAGRFRIGLRPGTYNLVASSSDAALYAAPILVQVRARQFTRVQIRLVSRRRTAPPNHTGCQACPPPPPAGP